MSELVSVIGAGSWGTALAKLVADKGIRTRLWARDEAVASAINERHENTKYLSGIALPASLEATSDLAEAVSEASAIVWVVPTHGLRAVLTSALPHIRPGTLHVSAIKGIEEGSLKLVSELFEELLPPDFHTELSFLGGPSFAKEVALAVPTAVSIASKHEETAKRAQAILSTDRFRVYTTEDVVGVEVGGALKNVIAIAVGIADGMGFGLNTRAGLITRGLAEINRLAMALGANPLTISGLSGMGDLVLTCTGDLSRNRQVGIALGKGEKLADIVARMSMVAEGIRTAHSANDLAQKRGIDMPITREVYEMIHTGKAPDLVVTSLTSRPMRHERE
jgi:glycerol-3-phosphate dehydrogenase (NAD(P)+)